MHLKIKPFPFISFCTVLTLSLAVCQARVGFIIGDWDCVAAVERLPALYYSVDFIFLSFGIMSFIVEL